MAQRAIIEKYQDGSVVISNLRNNLGVQIFGTNETITATLVSQYYDGTIMNDSKVDGKIYLKLKYLPTGSDDFMQQYIGKYFLVNLPNFGEKFLYKDAIVRDSSTPDGNTVLRELSSTEILLLKMKYYKGVKVSGYYKNGDIPGSIDYYLSTTSLIDDGGSVIDVGGIKLEHNFVGEVDALRFGADRSGVKDSSPFIQKALDYLQGKGGIVNLPEGRFKILSALTVHSGVTISGIGYRESYPANTNNRVTQFWKEGNFTAIKLIGSSFASDFCLDGNTSTNSGDGLQLAGNNAEAYRVIVTGMGGNGVVVGDKLVEGNRNSWKIEAVKSIRNGGHGFVIDDYNPGYGPDANAGMAIKCNAWENNGDGWYIDDCAVNTFIQCYAESNKSNGFHVLSKARRNMFFNCGSEQNTINQFILDSGSANNFVFGAFDYMPVDNGGNSWGVSTGGANQLMNFSRLLRSGIDTSLSRQLSHGLEAIGTIPGILLKDVDANENNKTWDVIANNGAFSVRLLDDNGSAPVVAFSIARSGKNVYEVKIPTRLIFNQLATNNLINATTLGSVIKKMQIYDASGTSIGYIPVYDNIT